MGLEQPVTLLRNGVQPEAGPFVPLGERPHVGFAGRLSSEKGAHLLLDAARQLPLLRFRLAGKGPDETTLRRRIEQEKLANVQLLGHLDQDSLRREMRTWRLAVVPSIMYENCPYAALDAMACQVPVIGADAGGLRELAAWSGISFKRGSAADLARTIDASFHRLSELEHHVSAGTRFVHDECSPERHVRSLVGVLSRSLP
jgi:glycosyltransferase involved in cell wall biosynthesis